MKQKIARYLLDAAEQRTFPATLLVPAWARVSAAVKRKPHSLLIRLCDRMAYDLPVVARLDNGLTMHVYWTDLGVGQRVLTTGTHEPETIALLRVLLKPGMIVFDVGAQVGQYTLESARAVGPTGAVHAFEPGPKNIALLRANIASNRLANVAVAAVALSDQPETRTLHLAISRNAGAHSFATSEIASGATVRVLCTTLDAYCREHRVSPDFMKMDVEGFEIAVLNGGRDTLTTAAPLLIVEFNDYAQGLFGRSCAELSRQLIDEYGYTLVRIDTPEPNTPSPRGVDTYFNVLAVPSRRLDAVLSGLPDPYRALAPDPAYAAWGLQCFAGKPRPSHQNGGSTRL